jgi:hypothetical protein
VLFLQAPGIPRSVESSVGGCSTLRSEEGQEEEGKKKRKKKKRKKK